MMNLSITNCRAASMTVLLCLAGHVWAQQTESISFLANAPQACDSITRQLLPYAYEGQGGENQVWDFSGLEATGYSRIDYGACGDSLLCMEEQTASCCQADEDGLWLTGYESTLESMGYQKRMMLMRYPLAYGETCTDSFEGEGLYSGTHFMRHFGTQRITADGRGTLILSEADTLPATLRVRTVTTSALRISRDSLQNDLDNLKQVVTERFQWYARGYRYPVFETVTSTSYHDMKPVATRQYALRCMSGMQLVLNDTINSEVRREMASITAGDIFTYEVENVQNRVTINYSLAADATLRVIVADAMGMLHKSLEQTRPAGQGHTLQVDCSDLRRGQYVIYMNVNGKVYNHKITVK